MPVPKGDTAWTFTKGTGKPELALVNVPPVEPFLWPATLTLLNAGVNG
jgi:hypothetical protein